MKNLLSNWQFKTINNTLYYKILISYILSRFQDIITNKTRRRRITCTTVHFLYKIFIFIVLFLIIPL
jgi:hypothetical protein